MSRRKFYAPAKRCWKQWGRRSFADAQDDKMVAQDDKRDTQDNKRINDGYSKKDDKHNDTLLQRSGECGADK